MSETAKAGEALPPPPPFWFRLGDAMLRGILGLAEGAGLLALGFALFALVCAGYAWWSMGHVAASRQFIREFLGLAWAMVLYGAVPPLAFAGLWHFFMESWRKACGQPGIFVERRQHPVLMGAVAVLLCVLTLCAHATLGGDWRLVPTRIMGGLDLPARAQPATAPVVARGRIPAGASGRPAGAVEARRGDAVR